mgnify:CR=1 FL=1
MFNKGQLAGLMKQAQAMQDNLKKAQDELAHIEVEGQSGSGLVKVLMTCKHEVRRVAIDPSLLADDKDMLEDLVAAAFNAAAEDRAVRAVLVTGSGRGFCGLCLLALTRFLFFTKTAFFGQFAPSPLRR